MTLTSIINKLALSLLLILTVSLGAFADTIRLKNGSIIKGHIVSFNGGKFTIAIGDGARLKHLTFVADEVESITFDPPADRPQINPSTRTSGSNSDGNAGTTNSQPPRVVITEPAARPSVSPSVTTASSINNAPRNADPAVTSVPRTSNSTVRSVPRTANSGSNAAPIAWNVKVLADNTSNGWTNSGWVLKKGQKIRITGDGTISLGKGKTTSASGIGDLADEQKLLKNVPTGALLAVIGDDNNDFIYIGSEREFTATRDGALFLGINEGFLDDNSGSFDVKVEILPDQGQ